MIGSKTSRIEKKSYMSNIVIKVRRANLEAGSAPGIFFLGGGGGNFNENVS